ncbi:2OG-Fe(II) oxygenase [Acinetobacter sp. c1-l78]|uniref:2OG-Fe(II) oxygenase n=1 Tax=Acinetobacter sp. c1-l78 TaxID=3342803 RepID=UPI0035B734CC
MDNILDQLSEQGFAVIDNAYPLAFIDAVRQECVQNLQRFRDAGIQNGVMQNIRSDQILWLDDSLPVSQQHIRVLNALAEQLNQAFYLGIKQVEAHFACYETGKFYAAHRDNPQQANHRVISSVWYVHDTWQADWHGELHLQDKHDHWHFITPESNRLALFQSDLLHEVRKTEQQRLSITAWLRDDFLESIDL